MNQNYIDTVRLLLAIAPAVFASGRFAMKGGTALNLFVQEMPRLSVDIDLVFVDHRLDRQAALNDIAMELAAVQATLTRQGYRAHLPATAKGEDVKLVVSNGAAQVKVEVNAVFRGTALPVEHHSLVVQGNPAWGLLPMQHLSELPALQWKLMNLSQLKKNNVASFAAQHQVLEQRLESLS
jgi:hypothetical protein